MVTPSIPARIRMHLPLIEGTPISMSGAIHPAEQSTAEECADCARLRGCQRCFEELVRRFQASLLHYLLRRVKRQQEAEDLVQETFLIAYSKIGTYRSSWRFSTWLFTIAHRLAVSDWRKRTAAENAVNRMPQRAAAVDPSSVAQASESRTRLWDVAEEVLEPEPVAALWLSYVELLSAEEIGLVLNRNANSVRILLHRARGRLRKALTERQISLESYHE